MAGGLDEDRPVLSRRESDGRLDIDCAVRHHNHSGHQFVVEVEDGAFVVISCVTRQQNRTCHRRREARGVLRPYRRQW
jgi:hypothetical protein